MPSVSFKAVESFSSEDPNYPASNLLKPGNKKWKCRAAGEPKAFVVLRLEEPAHITGIDIGNEHSALIEVLVARSGPSNPAFTEILLATKFMNPVDSRNSTSTNGVQCFGSSALIPSVAGEKWDLVKIICTQPFNSLVKYGLTFVALHTTATGGGVDKKEKKSLVPEKFQQQIRQEADKSKDKPLGGLNLGRFKLREESPDSDDAGSSSVFARWKNKTAATISSTTAGPSVSALMRDASNTPKVLQKNIPTPGSVRSVAQAKPKPQTFAASDEEEDVKIVHTSVKVNRNDVSVLYDAEDDKPTKKVNESVAASHARSEGRRRESALTPKAESKKPSKLHDTSSSKFKEFLNLAGSTNGELKRNDERKSLTATTPEARKPLTNHVHSEQKKNTPVKPLDQSRPPLSIEKQKVPSAKRLSSPSKSPDNNHGDASPNLKKPRLSNGPVEDSETEVQRKPVQYKPFGKLLENVVLVISGIQNPDRADIRNQALAMGAKYKPDWDASCTHLICAYKNTPKYNQVHGKGKIVKQDWIKKCYTNRKRLSWRKFALDTAEANASDSEGEIVDIANKPADKVEENQSDDVTVVDTVQEEAVMLHELSDTDEDAIYGQSAQKVYEKSTEEEGDRANEDSGTVDGGLDFFKGKKFYLHPELPAVDNIKLERYIQTFRGSVCTEMTRADYVIARSKHTLPSSCRAELVKPLWVYECNDMECLIPVNRYRIV
ncbi:AGAP002605-PA [Anopheles gambiae str. PEST]|uniref:AGAP002605-PA n=1 Tax=Anopheles gambiae TaxID=7165 RepID=Q7QCF7_ANOGA|nr:DNA repair protein XRCC1 [Anopheles gambiae]EAA07652.5 AGAP002605-PA [Anopheles gambiae str. PEST]